MGCYEQIRKCLSQIMSIYISSPCISNQLLSLPSTILQSTSFQESWLNSALFTCSRKSQSPPIPSCGPVAEAGLLTPDVCSCRSLGLPQPFPPFSDSRACAVNSQELGLKYLASRNLYRRLQAGRVELVQMNTLQGVHSPLEGSGCQVPGL